ncbi:MAG TPA: hypothetical protein VFI95_12445 [Terriglobales bacterium]|jgi:hypothetical protein|nr:hypothetical protein [Terriglobales bacterium]
MPRTTTVVDPSHFTSFEDAAVLKFFEHSRFLEIPKQLADTSFNAGKGRLLDALPKTSCV